MIASDHPADRPRPLALALFISLVVAVVDVAVQVLTAPESFSLHQLTLAIAVNVALLGLLAGLVVAVGSLILRPQKDASTPFRSFFVPAAATAATLGAVGAAQALSGAAAVAAFIGGALLLPAALGRFVRGRVVRFAVGLAWLACTLTTAAATTRTVRHLHEWSSPGPGSANATQGPNILLIVVDTLRFDRVGAGSDSTLTPNLDRLAESSLVYTHAVSTAPWTLPMHASLFTGLYPQTHGVSWGHYALDDRYPVLAELLGNRGYRTFGISNNWLVSRDNGFARGFDAFMELPNDPLMNGWRLALRGRALGELLQWLGLPMGLGDDAGSAWTNWLVQRRIRTVGNEPFFAFINYFEPHDPYLPPPQFAETHLSAAQLAAYATLQQRQEDLCAHACGQTATFSAEQIGLMAALYDAEVAYQDAMLGRLLDGLQLQGRLDDTWVVVTSDHGELFGESDLVFHTAGSHWQLLHVPLIVRPPRGTDPKIIHAPVQPVDVFHTLVELAGGVVPAHVTQSFPLPTGESRTNGRTLCVSQSFGASITGLFVTQYRDMQADVTRWMHWTTSVYADGLLLEIHSREPKSLFDVSTDPNTEHDLLPQQPADAERLLRDLQQWQNQSPKGEIL